MSLVEQFKAWVADQPPQTTIDHYSWESCALGEFARTLPETEDGGTVEGWDVAASLNVVYGSKPYNTIGNGGRSWRGLRGETEQVSLSNYGELSTWLNSLEPVCESA